MHLNPVFISNIQDIYKQEGKTWLKDLSVNINILSKSWDFRFLKPMPGLSYNFVGVVYFNQTGKLAVLKMAPKGGNLITEMRWLKCVEGGVPKIYSFDETLNAFLMEFLEPGYTLKKIVKAGDDDGATRIICDTIKKFQSQHC